MPLQDEIRQIADMQSNLRADQTDLEARLNARIDALQAEVNKITPKPTAVSKYSFLQLLLSAGGMTQENFALAADDPQLKMFWLLFDVCVEVDRQETATVDGLQAMEGLGYLPEGGAQAVLDAWPEVSA
jgi:hypothetical protein